MWADFEATRYRLLLIGVPRQLREPAKGVGVVDREIGQHLSIDVDAGCAEAGHEPAVAHPLAASRGVDPGDPQGAELTLLFAPVPVGVPHGTLRGLLGGLVELAPATPSTLGGLHDFLLAGVMGHATLHAGHRSSLRLEEPTHSREIRRAHQVALLEPVLPLARLLGQNMTVVRVPAFELATAGGLETLHCRAFGLLLRHLYSSSHFVRLGRYQPPFTYRPSGYLGAITIVIFRPSSFASDSIFPTSARVAATRSSTAFPSSRWAICRPRNIMVTLTLFPSPRNSRACRVLKSKS